ncbi:LacI family transcriptional regulator [Mycoplasmopsis pullorum]|uniref:LacI family DNA-binding transcriptional regulator n=1 Tax=Mycoplasmopsis pullorum TaxID=48003 RepID=UPI00111933AC|nr:LacI family DNA-binding transcriptional regulator [Mycoplasmopsis pullorum]TNK82244.1 LacI family transcriptional regulator [Mycoplasmopsis pullorum]TNK83360.1 LacI family transcriptional regulator [Mycoplasmopsis pullorum]TNK84776.1 LacI family transcriptional regulator [Mycoplasmopsis pullorum]TNK85819.1 LacI family transcriptional regulator [Mycoplasmopsis pullorum]TNK86365.1 LacI family transcriptional regulator [Mycoplasmopsis pullorum]
MKTISYKDISKMANVSISTVSRYYNNGYVSKRTKEKIEKVVQQFEYYPNHGARLIRGRDNSIFIIVPEWPQGLYMAIANGIVQSAKIHNKKVNTTFTEVSTKEYIETVRYVLSWRPTSLVLFVPEYDEQLFSYLRTIEDTSIVVFGHEVEGLNWIKVDETHAFYNLTNVFHSTITDNQKMMLVVDKKLNKVQIEDRKQGFINACNDLGVEYEIYELAGKSKSSIAELNKYTRKQKISNVVCSTHEVFISLNVLGDKSLRLTDFGYQSVYDYIRTYKAKIFVDYPSIGVEIENMIWVHNVDYVLKSKLIKTRIIS